VGSPTLALDEPGVVGDEIRQDYVSMLPELRRMLTLPSRP